jgi:hypothetical protein
MEDALYTALDMPPKFSPLTIDGTAKLMMAGAMGRFYGLNPKADYDNVEMLVYVGTNPMVSHAHNTGMFYPGRTDQLHATVLYDEPRVLLVPLDHHLAGKESITP